MTARTRTLTLGTLAAAAIAVAGSLTGCSDRTAYASAEGQAPPYILKEGCTFSIVVENARSSISSPAVTGVEASAASASISLGEYSITVSDCAIVENSHLLPIYED